MANIKDFAAGIVVTPPSPATSGTSLTLRAGDGASMPTPPFYVTATPPGQLTTLGTSEKLLVTAVSTDTLTIVRAQSPTTAKSIDANWVVANAMYVDDVMKSNIATDELLTGTVNGSNTVFTTASSFTAIQVYKNGVAMHVGDDFTVTGSNQITMVTAPTTGTKLTATYIIGSQVMIAGSSSLTTDETPTGSVNGSNTSFTTAKPYVANTLQVYVNGVKQKRGTHFSEVTPTSGTFTISDAPLTGDDVMVEYQFVQSVAGNADTVDGYHANATPTANTILPLDGSGIFPASVHGTSWTSYTPTTTFITLGNGTLSGKCFQLGKLTFFEITLVFGTTTAITSAYPIFSLPFSAASPGTNIGVGQAQFTYLDTGVQWYYGQQKIRSGNTALAAPVTNASSTYLYESGVSSTVPFTWGSTDVLYVSGYYEAT